MKILYKSYKIKNSIKFFIKTKSIQQYFHTPINSPQEVKKIFAKPQFFNFTFFLHFVFVKLLFAPMLICKRKEF